MLCHKIHSLNPFMTNHEYPHVYPACLLDQSFPSGPDFVSYECFSNRVALLKICMLFCGR